MKNKIFWSLLAIATFAGWNVATAQSERLYSEPDETLLTSEAPPADSLHVMDADGRNLRRFVSHREYTAHGSPAWSCDGSKLAFDAWRSRRGETYVDAHIFTCNADGSQLKDIGIGAMPSWSPDGSRLVFSNYSPRGVWLMKADGTERGLFDADGWGAEWSPTADRIAYSVRGRSANIVVQELSRKTPRRLLDDRYSTVYWGMAWSPDGNWIAFKGETQSGSTELAVVHVDGHEKGFRVLLPVTLPDMTDLLHNPCWSPDGKQIIAAVITKANPARQLYLVDVAGKEPAKLLAGLEKDRWYNDMAWSPDEKRIVVSTRQTAIEPAVQWLNAPLEQPYPWQPFSTRGLPAGVPVPTPGTVTPAASQLPSDALELLNRYEREKAAIQHEAGQKIREQRQKLIEELKPLQDKYTREAKLDEAVAIRDLIRTLKEPVENVLPDPGSEQDPAVAELTGLGAKLGAKGARGSWSPDGKRLAVGKMPFGKGVYLIQVVGPDADASAARIPLPFGKPSGEVTEFLPDGKDPAWSPKDGKWIAFTREVGSGVSATEEIWLSAADQVVRGKPVPGALRRLGTGVMATWSADATTVFFSNPQTREILSIRVDKPNAEPALLCKAVGERFPDLWYPAVAPDGRHVAYHADGQLKIADMTAQKIVGSWPLDGWRGFLGGWSPDGGGLGYGAFGGEEKGLWALSFIDDGKTVLPQPLKILSGSCTLPSWSPDGSKLAFDFRSPQRGYEVWTVDAKRLQVPSVDQVLAPQVPITLAPKANQELKKSFNEDGLDNSLAELPQGLKEFGGVKFEIGPGCIRLRGNQRANLPQAAEGIPVGFCLGKLHFLHATEFGAFGDESHPFFVKDGTCIGHYKVHYADGSTATIPIVYGEDVRDWWNWDKSKEAKRGKVVWSGKNADAGQYDVPLRLYLSTWDNPKPDAKVTTIDYVSAGKTAASPFCVAVTAHTTVAEKKGDAPPTASSAEARLPVVTVYHLKHGSAEAIAKELTSLFAGQENCRFAADSRKNALIVHGTQDQHDKIQQAIRSLDVPPAGER